jgi:hypothetical protein
MAIDRFTFYAKHYKDIRHLLELDEDVGETYPKELWKDLRAYFTDAFAAGPLAQGNNFAGLSDWQCNDEEDGPQDGFAFWNRRHYDSESERGTCFYIAELSNAAQRVQSIERRTLAPLVPCYMEFEGRRGPDGVTLDKLIKAVRRAAVKLKKAGFKEIEGGIKGCYVGIELGDLLHISTLGNRERNFAELIKRVEKLVRACIPVIERAARM